MRRFFYFFALVTALEINLSPGAAQQTADEQIRSLIDQANKKANLKLDPTTPVSVSSAC